MTDQSLLDVFGPLPTRRTRGEWAPVGHRKEQYRQVSRDYAPVEKLQMTDEEIATFARHGLADTVKFRASGRLSGEFFWNPREPNYTIHPANNGLGINMIVMNMQMHMIGAWKIFFPFEAVYPHPVLQDMWYENFSL